MSNIVDSTRYTYQTKSGYPARIICRDRIGDGSIIALVLVDGTEIIMSYTQDLIPTDEGFSHEMRLSGVNE